MYHCGQLADVIHLPSRYEDDVVWDIIAMCKTVISCVICITMFFGFNPLLSEYAIDCGTFIDNPTDVEMWQVSP